MTKENAKQKFRLKNMQKALFKLKIKKARALFAFLKSFLLFCIFLLIFCKFFISNQVGI